MSEATFDRTTGLPAPRPARLVVPGLGRLYRWGEPLAYALVRINLGLTVFTHGYPKLTGAQHGAMGDPFGVTILLVDKYLHLPAPTALAWLVTLNETVGALFLAAGFLTRIVAPMLAIEMLFAIGVFWPVWPAADKGFEYVFFLSVLSLFVSMRGGGRFSVDRLIGREI